MMRVWMMVVLACAADAAHAQAAAQAQPQAQAPAPASPAPVTPRDDEPSTPAPAPAPAQPTTPAQPAQPSPVPAPDEPSNAHLPLAVGSAAGCVVLGGVPGIIGLSSVIATTAIALNTGEGCAAIGLAVAQVAGVVVAVPMMGLFGPLSALGAGCGGLAAGLFTGQDLWTIVWWTLPGLGLGLIGGVIAGAGLLLSINEDPRNRTIKDAAVPLAITGSVLSSLAGPVTIGLISLTAHPATPDDDESEQLGDAKGAKPVSYHRSMRY
jgi:hypothetical protein